MAASSNQKIDYLLKKIGYTASKTGIAEDGSISGTKKSPSGEAIASPLVVPNASVWADSNSIPTTPPGSDTSQVKVYLAGTSGLRMTVDSTIAGSRSFIAYTTYNNTSSAILGDWIDTQFGSSYIIKVYKGDPNSGGTQLSAAGSGSNDGWFFDYSSGVLNFNDTNVPSGVTDTNIYIVGYRYIATKGVGSGNVATATALQNARNIGGVSFDGTANIDLPGVNTAGNQNTSGNAATATNATNVTGSIASAVTATTQSASDNTTKVATTAYVETAVSNLVDGSPGALNTLNELAAALNDDASFSTTVTNSIAAKLPLTGGTMTGNIVMSGSETVDGRDLSVDGSKLDGIAAGAEVNVQSDWNSSSGDNLILNKPTIPTNNNQLTNGAGYIVGSGVASLNHMGVTGVSTFSGNVRLSAQLQDGNGNFGTSGQVLTSDGTDTLWNDITFDSANLNVTGIATINHMRTVGVATFASLHSNLFSTGISTISGFRFPSSDGSEDQALVTDGSGNLSFKTLSGGGGGGATGAATTISTGISTATQGQTAFTTPHPHNDGSSTYSHQVFVNGLKMRNQGGSSTKDFTYSSNSTITFESPGLDAGDEYRAVVYFGHTLDEEFFTATQGQTVFALTGSLTAQKNFKVYVNGVKLRNGTDYGVASPVTLVQAAQAGDHIEIVCDNAEDSFTATQGQTSFTPTSTDISTDNMQVYHNGLVLNLTGDYTIGSPSVTLTDGSGLNAGDQVDVVIRRT